MSFPTWCELAKRTGAADDPLIRERLTRSWVGLQTMRSYALATMDVEAEAGQAGTGQRVEAVVGQLASRPRRAGDGRRRARPVWWPTDGEFDEWQRLFLFTRADTIYGGSNEIQRNIIAERVLGLPREVKG